MNVAKMSYEELLDKRDNANHIIDDAKSTLTVVNEEILRRLKEEELQGKVVDDWAVSRVTRFSYKNVSLETADALGCTKQAIDSVKLRKLYSSGVDVDGVGEYEYIRVTRVVDDDQD